MLENEEMLPSIGDRSRSDSSCVDSYREIHRYHWRDVDVEEERLPGWKQLQGLRIEFVDAQYWCLVHVGSPPSGAMRAR
jgi:hypothetical protein